MKMNKSIIESQGIKAGNFEETLTAAGLDWTAQEDSVGGMDTGIVMPRKKLLYRSDNHQALGIVGKDYRPTDPKEFLRSQFEFAEFIKGNVTRAGFLKENSRAFAFINIGDINIPKGSSKVGDPVRAYIYSTDGWDGGTPRQSRLYIERLACSNGMTSRKLHASLWVSHTKSMEERYSDRWKRFLNEIQVGVAGIEREFTELSNTSMNSEQVNEFLVKLIPGDGTRIDNRRAAISDLFVRGQGDGGSSRWDAYNAVTEYVTHQRSYRNTENVSADVNRFLGVLETNTLSDRALALLN